jgi:uncharacterized protein (TIGR02246 family)
MEGAQHAPSDQEKADERQRPQMKEPTMTTSNKQRAARSWPRRIKLTIVAPIVAALGLGFQLAGPHLAANAEPQLASSQANTQDAAIRRLHARIDAAWNRGDATGVAANWTTDGVNISPFGARFTGRADIASDIAETLRYLPGSTHELALANIHWARPNMAVADGESIISNLKDPTTGDPLPPLTAKFTSVSVQEHSQWRIAYLVAYTFLQPSGTT